MAVKVEEVACGYNVQVYLQFKPSAIVVFLIKNYVYITWLIGHNGDRKMIVSLGPAYIVDSIDS